MHVDSYDLSEPGYACDLGAGVLMNSAGSPVIDCIHNPPYRGSEAVLEFGDFSCVSRSDGITCLDSYGSGFTMGRKAYVEH